MSLEIRIDDYNQEIKKIEDQIAYHKEIVAMHEEIAGRLSFMLNRYLENPPPHVHIIQENPKLGKEFVRDFMRKVMKPIRTADIIEMCFPNADEETKSKQIKNLSVIFNTLVKDGTVEMKKEPGVKGNFYTWVEK